ncbi:MAG: ABC transporter substrate-binding protein [Chloroflexota bacterium]
MHRPRWLVLGILAGLVLLTIVLAALRLRSPDAAPAALSPTFAAPHPILGDLRVRQAIAHCTDRAGLIRAVYPWLADTSPNEMDSFLPADHPFYAGEDAFSRYPYDAAKGQALLEGAGWILPEGTPYRVNAGGQELRLTLTTTESAFRKTWVPVFVEQMEACGLRVEVIHLPAEEFYAAEGTLQTRGFELAAYAWVAQYDLEVRSRFACDRIPSSENGWQGQNFSGWCNSKADEAARQAAGSLEEEARRSSYRILQEEYTRDLPGLPLFQRVGVGATRADMQNFAPLPGEVYTWNAAQWLIPGQEVIVIGERSEPAGLHPLDDSWVNLTVHALIDGLDYVNTGYDYQPVTLTEFPTLENGGATLDAVTVEADTEVIDADGNPVTLEPGVRILDAQGEEVVFEGGVVKMSRLDVTYEFIAGLTWSDGIPVTRADYQLAYEVLCNPEAGGEYLEPPPACEKIASVDFHSDNAYTVTWKPGYHDPQYFLPPIGRQPAHRMTEWGRLDEVPADYWQWLEEVNTTPIGVGPYMLTEREYGQQMVFTANPYYYGGTPTTPAIVIRFIPQPETGDYLLRGEIDVLDSTSLLWNEISDVLLQGQSEGKIRLYFTPEYYYEQIDFALFVKQP